MKKLPDWNALGSDPKHRAWRAGILVGRLAGRRQEIHEQIRDLRHYGEPITLQHARIDTSKELALLEAISKC